MHGGESNLIEMTEIERMVSALQLERRMLPAGSEFEGSNGKAEVKSRLRAARGNATRTMCFTRSPSCGPGAGRYGHSREEVHVHPVNLHLGLAHKGASR